jgi:hypothetical protein
MINRLVREMRKATQVRNEDNQVMQLVRFILGGIGWTPLFLGIRGLPNALFYLLCRICRTSQLTTKDRSYSKLAPTKPPQLNNNQRYSNMSWLPKTSEKYRFSLNRPAVTGVTGEFRSS